MVSAIVSVDELQGAISARNEINHLESAIALYYPATKK
jgi:hypothetical protein